MVNQRLQLIGHEARVDAVERYVDALDEHAKPTFSDLAGVARDVVALVVVRVAGRGTAGENGVSLDEQLVKDGDRVAFESEVWAFRGALAVDEGGGRRGDQVDPCGEGPDGKKGEYEVGHGSGLGRGKRRGGKGFFV